MLANLLHDVRYPLHGFALRPMFAVVAVLLAPAAFLASYWPARRASRVDPVVALPAE
jgi:ABC-type lipoprotein release transport system permease subunit